MHNRRGSPRLWSTAALLFLTAFVASLAAVVLPAAPAHAQGCTELVTNGGFETTSGWQLGVSPVPPQYVTYTAHSGTRSLQLGITSGANVQSYSSARQTVTIPAGASQVTLSYWFYAIAEAPATTDYMELALLSPDGSTILAKPWQSHNDARLWNQIAFDLSSWQGQTVQLYFNVYNDGAGGKAAMFLDDVSLTTCPGPVPPGTGTPTRTPGATTTATRTSTPNVIPPSATPSPTPGCTDLVRNGDFSAGLGYWEIVGDPNGVTVGTDQYHSAPYSLKLGSLNLTLNGLAAARQMITIPAGSPVVNLDVWIFTQSEPGAGADYQEIALLNSSGGLLFVPYRGPSNDNAWVRLQFNLAAFAGETVYLRFAVNNDGVGGRTAMYVDDVHMTACSSGAIPTAIPTVRPTATGTSAPPPPPPTATWTPLPTYYPPPPQPTYSVPTGCTELTQNGGFEAGLAPWVPGADLLRPAIVTLPALAGAYAAQLGTQTQNINSYSSIRQTVSVPLGYARTIVSFWTYTWAEVIGGTDKQEFVLIGPGNVVWAVPWKVLENSQAWQQHIFELVGVGGQTFDLYFAAINDGASGRTALYLDEVHLWGCAGNASPFSTSAQEASAPIAAEPAAMQPQAVPVPQVYPIETIPPEIAGAAPVVAGTETPSASLPYAQWTEVAIAGGAAPAVATGISAAQATLIPEVAATAVARVGTVVAATAVAQLGTAAVNMAAPEGTPIVTVSTTPQTPTFMSNLTARINSITARWPAGWQKVVLAILAIIVIVLVVRWLRR